MHYYITTEEQLKNAVEKYIAPYCADKNAILAFDIESYSLDDTFPRPILQANGTYSGQIRTIQIGLNPDRAISMGGIQFVIDAKYIPYSVITQHLGYYLTNYSLVGHNIKYDYQFAFALLKIRPKKMIDTMLLGQILYAGAVRNHGLVDCYEYLLEYSWFVNNAEMNFKEYKAFKESQQTADWTGELTPDNIKYAAHDVFFIFYCLEEFKTKLTEWEKNQERRFKPGTGIRHVAKLEFNLIPVYAMMELRGMPFDIQYHETHVMRILQEEKDKAAGKCRKLTRTYETETGVGRGKNRTVSIEKITEPININSHAQLKPVLEELINKDLVASYQFLVRLPGTGEDVIKKYLNDLSISKYLTNETKDTLRTVLMYKKASSLLSKFGQKLIDATSNRGYLHPSWFLMGDFEGSVATGRSSCKQPNLQQSPSRGALFASGDFKGYDATDLFRKAYRAKPGYKIVCADYPQIEARLAALLCGATDLVRRFNEDTIDIYGAIAKAMMDLSYEPSKESTNEYERYLRNYIGKTAGLSLIYWVHWKSLSKFMFDKTEGQVHWNDTEAEQAYNNFFKNFPEVKVSHEMYKHKVASLAKEAGSLLPFTKRKGKELVPYHIAFSGTGLKRPRRFVLKPDQLRLGEFDLSPKAPRRVDEEGITRSNVFNERISSAVREGFNHEIQSSAANILKYAALLIHNELEAKGLDWEEGIVALVHDEVLCHVKEENADMVKEVVERCMKKAGEDLAPGLIFKIKGKVADTWAEAK